MLAAVWSGQGDERKVIAALFGLGVSPDPLTFATTRNLLLNSFAQAEVEHVIAIHFSDPEDGWRFAQSHLLHFPRSIWRHPYSERVGADI